MVPDASGGFPDAIVIVVAIVPVKESNETHGPHPLCVYLKHLQVSPLKITDFEKMYKRNWKKGSIHFSLQNSELPLIILVIISIGNHHFLGCLVFRSFVGHCLSCRKMASNVKQTCPLRP